MSSYEGPDYPTDPPANFNPDKPFDDPIAFLEMREHNVREKYIRMEEAKILREQVRQCYQREGVNHIVNCKEIVQKYIATKEDCGVHGRASGPFQKK